MVFVVCMAIVGLGLLATIALMVWGLCAAAKRGDQQIERNARELPPRFPHSQMRSHQRQPLAHSRRGHA